MAKILVIEGNKVTRLAQTKFTEEGKLQDYLEEYPSLIPLGEIVEGASDLLCIGREVGIPSGAIDLLFIDKDGLLTVVETKLVKNPEIRREVIGQIVEYASYISQWTADDVYRVASEYFSKSEMVPSGYKGSTLDGVMKKLGGDEFSDEDFRSNIWQNVKDGRIRLIIAVDELVEPLRVIVTFLNAYSKFDILLLQVSSFEESKSRKVLIPSLFGYKPLPQSPVRKKWDEERFFTDTKEKCEGLMVDAIIELYKFTKSNADDISWGTGAFTGSFTFRKLGHKTLVSVFAVYSNGDIQLNFGDMKGKGLEEESLESFRAKLNEILDVKLPEDVVTKQGKYPYMKANFITKAQNLESFQSAVLALCQQIESSGDKQENVQTI
ncbi:MAG: hypothetical protein H8E40_12010 [Chloroflexi bacterium]|nr:hypothetical protein [Chloroflexota bacterium]